VFDVDKPVGDPDAGGFANNVGCADGWHKDFAAKATAAKIQREKRPSQSPSRAPASAMAAGWLAITAFRSKLQGNEVEKERRHWQKGAAGSAWPQCPRPSRKLRQPITRNRAQHDKAQVLSPSVTIKEIGRQHHGGDKQLPEPRTACVRVGAVTGVNAHPWRARGPTHACPRTRNAVCLVK